ncbi:ABC transporter ATP-binding protein/permease [Rhodomicrobium udaipurense]|uniref:ABC transporter ATP-binding protein/permease n=1 Tax=Rhodomicrobium udaipurense TaxID=1202716 RepID=UPI0009DE8F47|nr:ABC transporter ATP-binding protein/permease [Rhodomicrobium udaipurense]
MSSVKQNETAPQESVYSQVRSLWKIIDGPKARNGLLLFGGAITGVIATNALVQIRLNTWQGNIYDAIGTRNLSIFMNEVVIFLVIVSTLLCLGVAQTWLHETLKVRLRKAVTFDLLKEWLSPRRAFQLPLTGAISVNPDQRIQEDTRRLCELTVDLVVGLIQSTLLLGAFVGVLWGLSAQVVFVYEGNAFTIPGYMVWAAIGYAAIGSLFTWLVGRPLIAAHTDLRVAEADFRINLVRVNESADEIALMHGEAAERELLHRPVDTVLMIMQKIANRLAALGWVTGSYGWLALLAPLLLAAPGYFSGSLSLGGLMMVVGAFGQVQAALRWYVDRFPTIAEWRAMLARVIGYRTALQTLEEKSSKTSHIRYEQSADNSVTLEKLCVYAPSGRVTLSEPLVRVAPGERVLISAAPKSGKTTFVKALAGIWGWGKGTISYPAGQRVAFVPDTIYLPTASLKTALAYPRPAEEIDDDEAIKALERVRLGKLASDLNVERRWEKELALDEQRRLMLANMLLYKPQWIIQDESIIELDDESRNLAASIFTHELADTALISVGRFDPGNGFYTRKVDLCTTPPSLHMPLRLENGELRETPEHA